MASLNRITLPRINTAWQHSDWSKKSFVMHHSVCVERSFFSQTPLGFPTPASCSHATSRCEQITIYNSKLSVSFCPSDLDTANCRRQVHKNSSICFLLKIVLDCFLSAALFFPFFSIGKYIRTYVNHVYYYYKPALLLPALSDLTWYLYEGSGGGAVDQ